MDKKFCDGLLAGLSPKDSLSRLLNLAVRWSREDLCTGIECVIDKLAVVEQAASLKPIVDSLNVKVGEYEKELKERSEEIESLKRSIEMMENRDPFSGVGEEHNAKPFEAASFGRAKGKKAK